MLLPYRLNLEILSATDTHDGFWRKKWEELAKKPETVEEIAKTEVLEEIALDNYESEPLTTQIIAKIKSNSLIIDRVIESGYDSEEEDEDLLMLW